MVPSNGASLPSSQPPKLFRDTYRSMYGLFQRGYMTLDSRLWNISRVIGGYSPNASLTRLYYDALGVSSNTNSSEMKKKAINGASSKDTYELFEKWCKKHGKTYSSAEEKRYRFKVFQESYASVTQHNRMGNSSYTAGLNYYSDRRNDEVPRGHLSEEQMNALDSANRNANSSEMKKKASDGASSKDTYELFEKWCKKHGKTYSSAEEKRYRFKVFQESYASVTRHNRMGNSSYTAGLNYYSDRRNDEVPRGHLSEEQMNALDSANRNANSSEMKKKAYDGVGFT